MGETDLNPSNPLGTWGMLVALLVVGVLVVALGVARAPALGIIFAAAAVQVYVIGRYYMCLRSEDVLIYSLALLPVATVIVLAFVLAPDVAMHR